MVVINAMQCRAEHIYMYTLQDEALCMHHKTNEIRLRLTKSIQLLSKHVGIYRATPFVVAVATTLHASRLATLPAVIPFNSGVVIVKFTFRSTVVGWVARSCVIRSLTEVAFVRDGSQREERESQNG